MADDYEKSAHRELTHHAAIFMFQDVAVVHVGVLTGYQRLSVTT